MTTLLKQLDYQNNTGWHVYFIFTFTMANCIVLFFTVFVGLAANVFVIWAVVHQKSLQTSNNALIVNLAIVDLIRSAVDCPLLLSIELRGHGIGQSGILLCDAQMAFFCVGCSVQLLTLASISAERYQAIANPFQHKQRRRRITVWIPLTWTVALLLAVFCLSRTIHAPVYLKCTGMHTLSTPAYDTFGRYILIPIWSGCFTVIIGFYGSIFWIVRTHNKKIFDKGVCPPPKNKLKIAVGDGQETVEDKSNKLEEHQSKKTKNVKTEIQKDDSPLAADKRPEAIETKERASVGLLQTENAKKTTTATAVISQDSTARSTPSAKVTINNCQPASPSPNIENKKSAYNSSPTVAATKQLEAMETDERASVRDGPPQAETAKATTTEIRVIPLDATNSYTPSPKEIKKSSNQPGPPSPKTENEISSCNNSFCVAIAKQPEIIQTEERASVREGMLQAETAEKTTPAIPVISLDGTSTALTDFEGSKVVNKPEPKLTVDTKVEEVTPLPAVEAPRLTNPPAAQDNEVAGAVCMMPSMAGKERASKKKEGKLAKRSGYIILTFVMFWTPLIVSIVVNFFIHRYDNKPVWIAMEVEILSISVACMTSATNPITYAAVNPQFRTEFRKLKVKFKRFKKLCLKKK